MPFTLYILRTSRNTLYIGQTNNLEKRLSQHRGKSKGGAKYLRAFADFALVYTEVYETRSEAMMREIELKKLTKKQKEEMVAGNR